METPKARALEKPKHCTCDERSGHVRSSARSGVECVTTTVDRRKRARAHPRKATLMTSRRLCLALSSVCLPARPNASYLRPCPHLRAERFQTISVSLGRVSASEGLVDNWSDNVPQCYGGLADVTSSRCERIAAAMAQSHLWNWSFLFLSQTSSSGSIYLDSKWRSCWWWKHLLLK